VTSIGDFAFDRCYSLARVTIPNSVTSIGDDAFFGCGSLASVTIPSSVTNIGDFAFSQCWGLTNVFFEGNAPAVGPNVFDGIDEPRGPLVFDPATVYFLAGTSGWSTSFAGLPTALWLPQIQNSDTSFGLRTNHFSLNITWADGLSVVVEASPSLTIPSGLPW
jgi:hypothetical protein